MGHTSIEMTDNLPDSIETDRMTEGEECAIEERIDEIDDHEKHSSTQEIAEHFDIDLE